MKIEFSNSILINAPQSHVWTALSNWADPSGWVPQLKSCEVISSQSKGLHAKRRLVEEDQILIEEAVAWDEPHRLAIQVTGVPPVVKNVIDTFTVAAATDGHTQFTVHSSSDTGLGLLGIVLAPIAKRVQRTELRRLLAAMKHFVETGSRATHFDADRLLVLVT